MKMSLLRQILLFAIAIAPIQIFGQCGTDANFVILHPNPDENQDVVIFYTGFIPFDSNWSYTVDFGDGNVNTGSGIPADGVLGINDYVNAGTYTVQVEVFDDINLCSNTISQSITVTDYPGTCAPEHLGAFVTNHCIRDSVSFEVTLNPVTGFTLVEVTWDFGDGSTLTTSSNPVNHLYDNPGIYYVTAYVTINDGQNNCSRYAVTSIDDGNGGLVDVGKRIVRIYDGDPQISIVPTNPVALNSVQFYYTGMPWVYEPNYANLWNWKFKLDANPPVSGSGLTTNTLLYTEASISVGAHQAVLEVYWKDGIEVCPQFDTLNFNVPQSPCDTCSSFQPEVGKKYWISAWVRVDEGQVKSYNPNNLVNSLNVNPATLVDAYIELEFVGGATTAQFYPTGEIIDGWQRIVGEFTVPASTYDLSLNLYADDNEDTYFDDIRIHPFNANMKSYVYDGDTFWLVSELDDNNYATFYEYDKEGGLVRIKKETSRGIVTIQETRSSTTKQ